MISVGRADSAAKQYTQRIKSLLTYAKQSGYCEFNVGAAIKVKMARRSVAKRIMSETEVALLVRAAKTPRDRLLLQMLYAAGLRLSELVTLTWGDVIERDGGKVQLSIIGKGSVPRDVLLPDLVSRNLLAFREDSGQDEAVFKSRWTGKAITTRGIHDMIKRTAERAGINPAVSAHWLRHRHASHALDRGATLADVQATLGHANVAMTSTYLHSRPDRSSGLKLDEGVWV